MPQPVADREQAPAVVERHRPVVLVEVRDIGKGGRQAVFVGRAQAGVQRQLDLAQTAGKGELLLVVDVLIVEHQHRVSVHAGMDVGDLGGGQRLAHVDALDLAGKARADLADGDGHGELLRGFAPILGAGRAVCHQIGLHRRPAPRRRNAPRRLPEANETAVARYLIASLSLWFDGRLAA